MKIFDSFWNPSFYKNNTKGFSFWKAFGRLVLVSFIISIVYAVVFYGTIGKNIPQYLETFTAQVEKGYPDTLVLSLQNGFLTKNIKGEIKLYPIADFAQAKDFQIKSGAHYFITIDDTKEVSLASFTASDALVFLAKDGWVTENNKDVRMNSYKSLGEAEKNLSFSKGTLTTILSYVNKNAGAIAPILVLAIIILCTIFAPLGYLLVALFIGLVVMLLSKWILPRKFVYGESYTLSLYALPSVIIVTKLASYLPYLSSVVSRIPFLTTLLVIGFLWLMFRKKTSHKEEITNATLS